MKRKTFSSRLLAILMTVALVLSFASVSAFAEGEASGESSSLTLQKYEETAKPEENIQAWTTITLDQEDQGVPVGTYAAVEIQANDIVILKQNSEDYLVFGISKEDLTSIWDSLCGMDGSLKKANPDSCIYPTQETESGVIYWQGTASNQGNYYYGYRQNGKIYVLASADDEQGKYKVSHFDVIGGAKPSTPEEPEKHSESDLEKKVADTESVTADTAWSDGITAGAGDTVTFKLSSTIPEYLANEDAYAITFHDVMDTELSLNTDSFTVFIDKDNDGVVDEGETTLTNEQYVLTNSENTTDECTFEITVDLKALSASSGPITSSDCGYSKIVVRYTATLAEDITAGCYENEAWVHYSDKDTTHDKVTVDTYGLKIVKYGLNSENQDDTSNHLNGAIFEIYPASAVVGGSELAENAKPLEINGETQFTTEEDGTIQINGLDEGTYYLKEVQAPDNYVLPTTLFRVSITKGDNSLVSNVFTAYIPNTEQGHTGGAGTMFYTFGGLAIVAAAGAVFLASRKSRKQSA